MSHDFTCHGKIRFYSRRSAKRFANEVRRNGGDHIDTYRCGACGLWHNGHSPRTTPQRHADGSNPSATSPKTNRPTTGPQRP